MNNEESILIYVKKLLGIQEDYTHFDPDVIYGINAAFGVLTQLGVGPEEGFMISDDSAKWNDFVSDDTRLSLIKPYVYLKTRLLFDPPSSNALIDSFNKTINEYEWRLYVASDGNDSLPKALDTIEKGLNIIIANENHYIGGENQNE